MIALDNNGQSTDQPCPIIIIELAVMRSIAVKLFRTLLANVFEGDRWVEWT